MSALARRPPGRPTASGNVEKRPDRKHAARLRLTLQGHDAFAGLPARSTLRRWIVRALQVDADLTLRFVGTREGRRLNRDFRRRDHATNVLTFNYAPSPVQADIVLCLPVVAREARLQGKPLRAHLAHLVIHGTLHAQGHEHETAAEAARMERLETRLLAGLGYPDPYRLAPQRTLRRPPIRAMS